MEVVDILDILDSTRLALAEWEGKILDSCKLQQCRVGVRGIKKNCVVQVLYHINSCENRAVRSVATEGFAIASTTNWNRSATYLSRCLDT